MGNIQTYMGDMVTCPKLLESCRTAKMNVVVDSCRSCPDFGGTDGRMVVCRYSAIGRRKKNYRQQIHLDTVDRDMDPFRAEVDEDLDSLI